MLKGCQKRMIFVKDTGCDLFDEAYFILKDDIPSNDEMENNIIRVATEIINQNNFLKSKKKSRKLPKNLLFFISGCFFSALISTFVFLVIL